MIEITLPAADRVRLAGCEEIIERGLSTFVEVGGALLTVRDGRLYRAHHTTFETYCRERWGFSHQRASQMIAAAEVATIVANSGLAVPSNEAQARKLAPLRIHPDAVRKAWAEVLEETDGKPTARDVRSAVRNRLPAREVEDRLLSLALTAVSRLHDSTSTAPRSVVIGMEPKRRHEVLAEARGAYVWLAEFITELERVEAR